MITFRFFFCFIERNQCRRASWSFSPHFRLKIQSKSSWILLQSFWRVSYWDFSLNFNSADLFSAYELPVRHLVWFTYYVSLFGFFTSISLTLIKDQTEAATTIWWCPVFDLLPTLSTATAYFYPQFYIWPICIGLTSFPRYLIVFLQMNDRLSRLHFTYRQSYVWIERINAFLHFLEITFLILISFVSVKERQDLHNYFVFAFGIVSTLHMFLTISIDYLWPQTSTAKMTENQLKIRSKRLKLFFINFFAFCSSICLYFYHLNFCITLLRSAHSFFQYVFILSNAVYHRLLVDEWDQQGIIKFSW